MNMKNLDSKYKKLLTEIKRLVYNKDRIDANVLRKLDKILHSKRNYKLWHMWTATDNDITIEWINKEMLQQIKIMTGGKVKCMHHYLLK